MEKEYRGTIKDSLSNKLKDSLFDGFVHGVRIVFNLEEVKNERGKEEGT